MIPPWKFKANLIFAIVSLIGLALFRALQSILATFINP